MCPLFMQILEIIVAHSRMRQGGSLVVWKQLGKVSCWESDKFWHEVYTIVFQ